MPAAAVVLAAALEEKKVRDAADAVSMRFVAAADAMLECKKCGFSGVHVLLREHETLGDECIAAREESAFLHIPLQPHTRMRWWWRQKMEQQYCSLEVHNQQHHRRRQSSSLRRT